MAQSLWCNTCCNPFEKPDHSAKRKNLRLVTERMCKIVPSIQMGSRICDDCRKRISKIIPETATSNLEVWNDPYIDHLESVASLNQYLGEVGETPINATSNLEVRNDPYIDPLESVASLNQYLGEVGETPINKAKLKQSTE